MGKQGIVFVTFWVIVLTLLLGYLFSRDEFEAVSIMAATDVLDEGKQVYAQFVYAQRLVLPDPVRVSRVDIPMYVTDERPIVRVYQAGVLVQEWDADTLEYVFIEPRELIGTLDVELDGGHIAHADIDRAPRVFVESADYVYPNGNFRVASNEKQGDIAMTLHGQRRVFERIMMRWRDGPGDMAKRTSTLVLILGLLSASPFVLFGDLRVE